MTAPRSAERAESPPVFLVGCGRSGTTLLRLMLNAHPDLSIPQESHVIYRVARRAALGRWPASVATDAGWAHLVDHLAETPYLDTWEFDRVPVRERLSGLAERTHAAAFGALFDEYLDQRGGTRWGDKTPQHVQYLLVLDRLFPTGKAVHVVRDGRDVALSLMSRPWGPRRMEIAGHYWAWLVLSGMVAGAVLGPERYREVRFEDLVTRPEATLRELCGWLGLPFRSELLDYHTTDDAVAYTRGGPVARKLATPPDAGHTQRWRQRMTPSDHRLIVRQAGGLLAHLGYEADGLPARQRRVRQRLDALPAAMPEVADRAAPLGGPAALRTARLLALRARQGAALVRGDVAGFAAASVRWQRTVAALLDGGPVRGAHPATADERRGVLGPRRAE